MDLTLLAQAEALCDRIKERMWAAATHKQQQEYYRLEKVYQSALRRYERRYNILFLENGT